jgi:hypothetical protein
MATSLAPGAHAIRAVYGGDGNTTGSASSTFAVNVSLANTTVTLNGPAGHPAAVFGQPYVVTATVAAVRPGAGLPTGVVVFYDNGVVAGSAWVVNRQAQAGLLLSPAGTSHTITASYLGDADFKPSTDPLVITVTAAPSQTALLSSPVKDWTGTAVGAYLVAAVAPTTPFAGTATGTVTFYVDNMPLATRALVNGSAYVYIGLIGANHSYTVRYNGNANLSASTSSVLRLGSGFTAMSARSLVSLAARGTIQAKRR